MFGSLETTCQLDVIPRDQTGPYSYAKICMQALILLTTQFSSSKLLKFNMRFILKKILLLKERKARTANGVCQEQHRWKTYRLELCVKHNEYK